MRIGAIVAEVQRGLYGNGCSHARGGTVNALCLGDVQPVCGGGAGSRSKGQRWARKWNDANSAPGKCRIIMLQSEATLWRSANQASTTCSGAMTDMGITCQNRGGRKWEVRGKGVCVCVVSNMGINFS